ncbi:hypothetical protein [Phreatobacter sp.]|uniref:hypothetical protein n=1 Tax=Phreatobacter sp. TaxID=1966341 RepID=UPI0025F5FCBD|nr:hypothetical protein [Phreatobacter sp.]
MDDLSEQEGALLSADDRAAGLRVAMTPEPGARTRRGQIRLAGSMGVLHRATAPA